jgi:LemA protein
MNFENILIGGLIVVFLLYIVSIYNHFVSLTQYVDEAKANLNNIRVRIEKIYTKIISDIEASGNYESSLLENVVKLRENVQSEDGTGLSEMSATLVRMEQYPELKALNLREKFQSEISRLERDIQTYLENANKTIRDFNTFCGSIPNNLFCKLWGQVKIDYVKTKN